MLRTCSNTVCYCFLRQLILITMYCHKLGNVLLIYIYSIYFSQQQLKKKKADVTTTMRRDEMVGWHYRLNRPESDQTPGDSEGQGSLDCCNAWNCKELDTTPKLNNNEAAIRRIQRVREFPGGPVVKTPHFQRKGHRFDHWLGTKIQHVMRCVQKKKKKELRI